MQSQKIAHWILLFGLAFVFAYFGIVKFTDPHTWIAWIPPWMDGLLGLNKNIWLQIIGVAELLMAIALLVPYSLIQRLAALAASLHLVAILSQVGWNDIGVRDIGLLFMALGLAVMPKQK